MVVAWRPTRIFGNSGLDLRQSVTVFPRERHDVTHSSSEWKGRPLEIPLPSPTHARGEMPSCASKADGERSAPVLLSIRILMATSNNNDIK